MKRFFALTTLLLVISLPALGAPDIGDDAIDFTVEEADLGMITLSDSFGKVIILNFWSST